MLVAEVGCIGHHHRWDACFPKGNVVAAGEVPHGEGTNELIATSVLMSIIKLHLVKLLGR